MALADVYDALISRRVYKDSMPHDKAVAIIQQGKGSHFDPDMVLLRSAGACRPAGRQPDLDQRRRHVP